MKFVLKKRVADKTESPGISVIKSKLWARSLNKGFGGAWYRR
tara:strand:- start:4887 stop:5012 length:126 start_codon:yes stop_codon:yes gene_type:complete